MKVEVVPLLNALQVYSNPGWESYQSGLRWSIKDAGLEKHVNDVIAPLNLEAGSATVYHIPGGNSLALSLEKDQLVIILSGDQLWAGEYNFPTAFARRNLVKATGTVTNKHEQPVVILVLDVKPVLFSSTQPTNLHYYERSRIKVIDDVITKDEAQFYIDNCQEVQSTGTLMKKDHKTVNIDEMFTDKNVRSVDILAMPMHLRKRANVLMSKVINDHLEEFYGVRISWFSSPQFLRYSIGGLYEPHTDGEDLVGGKLHRIFDRDFSLLIYLNDDYEGGELVFPIQKLTIKPKAYQAVFFPSSIRFSHGAKKLLTGKRYAFVSWLTAVGTRRECKVTPDRVMRDNDKGKFS